MNIEQTDDLITYLRTARLIESDETPRIELLAGGVSNRTVLVERSSGESWVIKQALEKLRTKADWFSSPERVHREALGLRQLEHLVPLGSLASFCFEDHEHHLLGMKAVPSPCENWKTLLLRGDVRMRHVTEFGRLLGLIHRGSMKRKAEFEPLFQDSSFFETLRLEPYYGYAAEQTPKAAVFLRDLIEETRSERHALTHGDYSPKNVLIHEDKIILLDHEVIHWGDPAFDIGFAMTHFLSKARHLPEFRAVFMEAARRFWSSYGDASFEPRAVRQTLGCLMARVAGRSPLEYLDDDERQRQSLVVLNLMSDPPARIADLIERVALCP